MANLNEECLLDFLSQPFKQVGKEVGQKNAVSSEQKSGIQKNGPIKNLSIKEPLFMEKPSNSPNWMQAVGRLLGQAQKGFPNA